MCLNALKRLFNPPDPPKADKPASAAAPEQVEAQVQRDDQLAAEQKQMEVLREREAKAARRATFGGIRSLISGLASGFGSNFRA